MADLSEDNLKTEDTPKLLGLLDSGSYGNSKLAGAIMSRILARKLHNTGVTSNTFHPGIVKTNIWNTDTKMTIKMYLWLAWMYIFGKSSHEGVQTLLELACANEVQYLNGKFFMECNPVWQPKKIYDNKFGAKIWELSEKYVNLKPEEKIDAIIEHWKKLDKEK